MIEICISARSIRVNGHANYADPGKDIVCSAVSALIQTLGYSLEDLTSDEITYSFDSGKALIEYRNLSEQVKLLVDYFFMN